MADNNFLNVFTGPDSVRKYFDPDSGPPLPLVEIPESLNPYRKDGVRIYAKMMSMHPANNVKSMPALNLLEKSVVPGKTKTIVEYSSGSTVISMSLVSRVFYGISDVRAFLSNKTSDAKLKLMQFFGLGITLFGGPSQPEPADHRGGIRVARAWAEESDDVINPNQYENDDNWKSHIRWTGPQILKQLPQINVICAGMGTSGTMTGLGTFFKSAKPSVYRLAVCTAAGDRVPGPRSFALLSPVEFPWRAAVDRVEEVGSHDSFALSLDLCREGIVCGPSSGFNLKGLFQLLERRRAEGTLSGLASGSGGGPDSGGQESQEEEIHCVFLCCDLPYQYINEYFDKLGPGYFPPINNEELTKVDLHRYDEAWELERSQALAKYFFFDEASGNDDDTTQQLDLDILRPRPGTSVIDLRQPADFAASHLPGSTSLPLASAAVGGSPFSDPTLLASTWTELEARFGGPDHPLSSLSTPAEIQQQQQQQQRVLVVCRDGDSSRVATSVLRARGHQADSLRGGVEALLPLLRRHHHHHHLQNDGVVKVKTFPAEEGGEVKQFPSPPPSDGDEAMSLSSGL
ncbi:tryptophan synthase beta subunit-like PLP-dependent enzyme [Xylariaceae sp. FL0804]|nr:tryptophan synthase beta subunit-like PLP-dependent enzyme [Xylariaceae sp. FL0804]